MGPDRALKGFLGSSELSRVTGWRVGDQSPGVKVEGHVKPCRFQRGGGGALWGLLPLLGPPGDRKGRGPHPAAAVGEGLIERWGRTAGGLLRRVA